ncbi:MAG TPA: hypothetical protein VGW39_17750 [Chthoniobacterales bacterium]|nr:hypothetical protein [Chthoniobacterales bacterium]
MSNTQLAIALAIVTISNQWIIAVFNRRAKQAKPKTKPVSSVATKAKRSFWQYLALGVDLLILIAGIYILWTVMTFTFGHPEMTPTLRMSAQVSLVVSGSAIIIVYQTHRVLYGVLDLLFP